MQHEAVRPKLSAVLGVLHSHFCSPFVACATAFEARALSLNVRATLSRPQPEPERGVRERAY